MEDFQSIDETFSFTDNTITTTTFSTAMNEILQKHITIDNDNHNLVYNEPFLFILIFNIFSKIESDVICYLRVC